MAAKLRKARDQAVSSQSPLEEPATLSNADLGSSAAMNKVMKLLGSKPPDPSSSGVTLGSVLETSLVPRDQGGRQWRITVRRVAERRLPGLETPLVLQKVSCSRGQ